MKKAPLTKKLHRCLEYTNRIINLLKKQQKEELSKLELRRLEKMSMYKLMMYNELDYALDLMDEKANNKW